MQHGEIIHRAGYDWLALVRGFHYAIPGLLQAGLHLIIDNAWCEADETRELLTELAGYHCVLIGLECPLAVLQQRESARGDRAPGLAEWEFGRVHSLMRYDLRFDSGALSTAEITAKIIAALEADSISAAGAAETLQALLLA